MSKRANAAGGGSAAYSPSPRIDPLADSMLRVRDKAQAQPVNDGFTTRREASIFRPKAFSRLELEGIGDSGWYAMQYRGV